jgi:cytochrome b561
MNIFKFIKKYFSQKFTPLVRYLHYSILVLVLLQIIISNFIEVSDKGVIGHSIIEYYSTWIHIGIGSLLVLLALVFSAVELSKHGFLYFYPYLSSDFSQLTKDLRALISFEMPESSPKGIVPIIQGLGLGALVLVALSGATWIILWAYDLSLANDAKEVHKLLTGLIEAYVVGHASMGLIHVFITFKEQKAANK